MINTDLFAIFTEKNIFFFVLFVCLFSYICLLYVWALRQELMEKKKVSKPSEWMSKYSERESFMRNDGSSYNKPTSIC